MPKHLKPGSHPIIFKIHGGFLTYGHSLFAPFFTPWVLKLTLEHSAILVSANYRLLPSANGVADLLEDLEDFWQWTHSHLPGAL
jgi:carboxylesterase type B